METESSDSEHWKGVRVLVTGSTGFAGSALLRRLHEAGAALTAIARPMSPRQHLDDLRVHWVLGEIYDPNVVAEACRDVDYIFHLASVYRKTVSSDELNHKVHIVGSQLLAQAALGCPQLKRFVFVSTVGVHGHIEQSPANEDYRLNPGDVYQRTKAEAELWFRAFAREHGLPFTVIRPVALYGPHETRLLKLFRLASYPVVPLLGRHDSQYHLIHIDDFISLLLLAARHPAGLNEIFIAGNPSSISLDNIIRQIAQEIGNHPRIIRLPAAPVYYLAAFIEWLYRDILKKEPPLHRRRVAFFTKDRSFDTRRIREKLGFQCRYTNEEGLRQTTRWYLDNGWLKKKRN